MYYRGVKIQVKKGDITEMDVDAIVNPANSYGLMGGGVALSIKNKGGIEIEEEAISNAPIQIGEAVATTGGRLNVGYVIHAPTMEEPAQPTNLDSIKKATLAALKMASELEISSIAFPGMGTGVGGVPKKEASVAMLKVIKDFLGSSPFKKIVLVAHSNDMYDAFKEALQDIL